MEEIKEQLEQFLSFKTNLYAMISSIATGIGLEEEEFKAFLDAINIDDTWDSYFEKFKRDFLDKEMEELMTLLDRVMKCEEECYPIIEERIDSYLKSKVEPKALH